jgi:hypothetical protein
MAISHWLDFFDKEKRFKHRLLKQLRKDGLDKAALRIAKIINDEVVSPYILPEFALMDIKPADWELGFQRLSVTKHHKKDLNRKPLYQSKVQAVNEIHEIIGYFTDLIDDDDLAMLLRAQVLNNIVHSWSNNLLHAEKISA